MDRLELQIPLKVAGLIRVRAFAGDQSSFGTADTIERLRLARGCASLIA
jgi:hypothetical protein